MLVECRSCNVSFDDSLGKCVVCGATYVFSEEEQRSACVKVVNQMVRHGKDNQTIREYLMETELFIEEEINKILKAVKESKEAANAGGIHLLAPAGGLLIALGQAELFDSVGWLFVCYGMGGLLARIIHQAMEYRRKLLV